jgi:hypothetical protein
LGRLPTVILFWDGHPFWDAYPISTISGRSTFLGRARSFRVICLPFWDGRSLSFLGIGLFYIIDKTSHRVTRVQKQKSKQPRHVPISGDFWQGSRTLPHSQNFAKSDPERQISRRFPHFPDFFFLAGVPREKKCAERALNFSKRVLILNILLVHQAVHQLKLLFL